jgi:hypothetical protein
MFFNLLKNKKELFFILLLLLFFYRSPYIFLNGRFGGEEGSTYFAYAYNNNFIASLFFVDFHSGYLNMWANISAIVANFFDLLYAPLVSNYLSLLPKIFIIYIALYKDSLLLNNFNYKILFCLIVFISPLNVPEIWLNSINSQIFFCILTFSLFLIKNLKDKINYIYIFLIIIAGLTGVYSNMLAPLFYFKYKKYKTLQDKYNLIFISITTIVQFFIVLKSKLSGSLYEGKIHSINLELLLNYVYNVFFKTFFSGDLIKYFHSLLGIKSNLILIIFFVTLLFLLIQFYYLVKKNLDFKSENSFLLFSLIYSFIAITFLVIIGAAGNYVGGRYAALPSFFLLNLILFLIKFFDKQKIVYLFIALLITSLCTGLYEFRPNSKNKRVKYIKFLDCIDCPDWSIEIEKYNQNKDYSLRIWPYPKKSMNLN